MNNKIEQWFGGVDRGKLGGIGWMMGMQAASVVVGLLTVVLAAPTLGADLFAIYAYLFSIATILATLTAGGEAVVIRRLASNPEERDRTVGAALGIRALGAGVSAALLIGAVALFGGPPGTTVLLAALAALFFVAPGLTAVDTWAKARERLAFLALPKIAISAIFAAAIVVLVEVDAGLESFVAVRGINGLAIGFSAVVAFRALVGPGGLRRLRFDPRWAKKQALEMLPILLAAFLISIQLRIDQVMLGQMSPAAELAAYGVAASFVHALAFVPATLYTVFYPSLVRAHLRDPARFDCHMQRLYDLLVLSALVCMAGLGAAAATFFLPIFGEEFAGGLPMLWVLLLSLPWSFLVVGRNSLLAIRGWLWTSAAVAAGSALVNVLLNVLLIPAYGGLGAAWATVVAQWFAAIGVALFVPRLRAAARGMGQALIAWRAAQRVLALAGGNLGR